jgi:predicted NBD/HSP70 family sugar kinase
LAKDIEALTGAPVYAGEWAACAAYGESHLNRSVETDRMLYIHSDLGKGVVIIKDSFTGPAGAANSDEGNGSLYLRPWDKALGLVESAKREVTRGIGTDIVKLAQASADNITESVVISAAKQKDEVASIILQNVSINLGLRISYLLNLFSPKTVVIGGGIEAAGDIMFATIKKMVDKLAFAKQAKAVSIIPGALGRDAVCLGAASMAVRELFINA